MAIFGRRRIKEIKREFVPPVDVREIPEMLERAGAAAPMPRSPFAPSQEQKREEDAGQQGQQPAFAPLFVKLTRYKQILNTLSSLKMSVNLIRNQLLILNELDRLKEENMKLLNSAVNKINDRLSKLDSEFMRPSGFMEEVPEMQMQDVESLESTLVDLKSQIEHLKSEVESVA